MTKEEFIKQRMEIDKVTRTYFDKNYIVIECTCGKEYCNGWRCLPKSYVVDYIKQLQQENNRLLELCMFSLIKDTKIYNHKLDNVNKIKFMDVIKNNINDDTYTLRKKLIEIWSCKE